MLNSFFVGAKFGIAKTTSLSNLFLHAFVAENRSCFKIKSSQRRDHGKSRETSSKGNLVHIPVFKQIAFFNAVNCRVGIKNY